MAWATYDIVLRRQAANRCSLDWGVVDTAACNEAFASQARVIPRCSYCLADTNLSFECAFAPAKSAAPGPIQPPLTLSPSAPHQVPPEMRLARAPARMPLGQGPGRRPPSTELCRLFNNPTANMCRFPWCRYEHSCIRCQGPHPASECPERHCLDGRPHTPPARPLPLRS